MESLLCRDSTQEFSNILSTKLLSLPQISGKHFIEEQQQSLAGFFKESYLQKPFKTTFFLSSSLHSIYNEGCLSMFHMYFKGRKSDG